MVADDAALRLAGDDQIVWRRWQHEVIVYHLASGAIHHLQGVAAAVFAELADGGPRPPSGLARWLAAETDLPVAQVEGPLAVSLESLSRCQLIVPQTTP
ncbi:hypothetical protein [Caenispirillum bisanense]|uniref:hypothetical protein n=1 Tax=Caenispirillum bisanense TaxID=414052 RepID=UPI0031D2E52D